MVSTTSANVGFYHQFHHPVLLESGAQPGEDSHELHSPIFGVPHHNPLAENMRYHPSAFDVHPLSSAANQFNFSLPATTHPQSLSAQPRSLSPTCPSPLHSRPGIPIPSPSHLELGYKSQRIPPMTRYTSTASPNHHLGQALASPSASERCLPSDTLPSSHHPPSSSSIPNAFSDSEGEYSSSPTNRRLSLTATPRIDDGRRDVPLVIACRQCRGRKIRCDSTRPSCHNCIRRSNECEYDAVPKRRGPDKRPGTRQRSCKKRPTDNASIAPPSPKRKRTLSIEGQQLATYARESNGQQRISPKITTTTKSDVSSLAHRKLAVAQGLGAVKNEPSPTSRLELDTDKYGAPATFPSPATTGETGPDSGGGRSLYILPSSFEDYHPRSGWDLILKTYTLKEITQELKDLFESDTHFLSFVSLPVLLRDLHDSEQRHIIHPAFIMASLALSMLIKSSETEVGLSGREHALMLRDYAQSHMEVSWTSNLITPSLAQAALIVALFESCPHPFHTPERAESAIIFLDNVIRHLGLTSIDYAHLKVSKFRPSTVPIVDAAPAATNARQSGIAPPSPPPAQCPCQQEGYYYYSHASQAYGWDPTWTVAETRNEQNRRVCWSALALVSRHASLASEFNAKVPNLFLGDPANFAIFFPGEAMHHSRPSTSHTAPSGSMAFHPKETVWALYCRSMLLWNFGARLNQQYMPYSESSARELFAEADLVLKILNEHSCDYDASLNNVCREYLFNTQITSLNLLRRFGSASNTSTMSSIRKRAEAWLSYSREAATRFRTTTRHMNEFEIEGRRPYQIAWLMTRLALCLTLWNDDHTLLNALDVAKMILSQLEIQNSLWPSASHQTRFDQLRKRLDDACRTAGVPLPSSPKMP